MGSTLIALFYYPPISFLVGTVLILLLSSCHGSGWLKKRGWTGQQLEISALLSGMGQNLSATVSRKDTAAKNAGKVRSLVQDRVYLLAFHQKFINFTHFVFCLISLSWTWVCYTRRETVWCCSCLTLMITRWTNLYVNLMSNVRSVEQTGQKGLAHLKACTVREYSEHTEL